MTQLSPATLAVVRCLARIVYEDFRAGQQAVIRKMRAHDGDGLAIDDDDALANAKRITRQ